MSAGKQERVEDLEPGGHDAAEFAPVQGVLDMLAAIADGGWSVVPVGERAPLMAAMQNLLLVHGGDATAAAAGMETLDAADVAADAAGGVTLDQLHAECLARIVSFLPAASVDAVRGTCRSLRVAVELSSQWAPRAALHSLCRGDVTPEDTALARRLFFPDAHRYHETEETELAPRQTAKFTPREDATLQKLLATAVAAFWFEARLRGAGGVPDHPRPGARVRVHGPELNGASGVVRDIDTWPALAALVREGAGGCLCCACRDRRHPPLSPLCMRSTAMCSHACQLDCAN